MKRLLGLCAVPVVLLFAGCGTPSINNEFEVLLQGLPNEMSSRTCRVAIGSSYFSSCEEFKEPYYGAGQTGLTDSTGRVCLKYCGSCILWVWQQRTADVDFALYLPDVSTNGCYVIRLSESSLLPWRGLKRGWVRVDAGYRDFAKAYKEGCMPFSLPPAHVAPLEGAGYKIKLTLPVSRLPPKFGDEAQQQRP